MNNTEISVIVPVYNVENYLGECLESLASQTFRNIEVIMVDDGSTDGSSAIAKNYSDKDSRFRYIHKENAGVSAARNTGLEYAEGKYLCLVDSDDVIPSEALGRMFSAAEENSADITVGKVMRLKDTEAGTARMSDIIFSDYEHLTSLRRNKTLLYDSITCCKLYRKSYWDSLGIRYPEDLAYCEDLPVALKLYCHTDKVVMLDEPVYLWRIREGDSLSQTQRKSLRMVENRVKAISIAAKYIREQVQDQELLRAKKYKDLFMDLNILINKAVELDDAALKQAVEIIRKYMLDEKLDKELSRLPVIYKLKYKAVLACDLNRLRSLREFQNDTARGIRIERRRDHVVGIFPPDVLKQRLTGMKTTIDAELLRQNILRIDVKDSRIEILGCAFLRYLPVRKYADADIRVWLVDDIRNRIAAVKVKRHETKTPAKIEARKNSNEVDYSGSGFTAILSGAEVSKLEPGCYRFLIEWDSCGQHREAIIARLKQEDIDKINGKSFPGAPEAVLGVTLNKEPVVIINEDKEENQELS